MIADAIIWLGILAAFLLILAVGGLIADRAGKVSVIRIEKSRTRTDKSWRDI